MPRWKSKGETGVKNGDLLAKSDMRVLDKEKQETKGKNVHQRDGVVEPCGKVCQG